AKQFGLEVQSIDVESLKSYQDWKLEDIPEEERSQYSDPEKHYAELAAELDAMKAEGELTDAQLTDAKLSSEKRKSLKGSAFCGPGRSFPVPDCAHVTAARRLIGRYKGEGTKSKILACVSRKAKALGCESKKKDADPTPVLADSIKNLLTDLHKITIFSFDDAKIPSDTLTCMDILHGHYHAADDQGKGAMRFSLYSHLGNWQSSCDRQYAMDRLKEIEEAGSEKKDSVAEIIL